MRETVVTFASFVALVVGMFALVALPAFVEDLWARLLARLTRPRVSTPLPPPSDSDRSEYAMHESHDIDEDAVRRASAEEALSKAEGELYRAAAPLFRVKMCALGLRQAAEKARADAAEATERAAQHAAELDREEESLEIQLPSHVEYLRRYNAQTRAGREPRYTAEGVRLIDYFDDYGLMRCLHRLGMADAYLEAERLHADALIGVALRLEAAAADADAERERATAALAPLRETAQEADARWTALTAGADETTGPDDRP